VITQGPFNLTLNVALAVHDPGATSNNPSTAVQIQNASPFIITANVAGFSLTIQSFTAQTVALGGGGQQGSITPVQTNQTGVTTAANSLTLVWLLPGEQAPMVDGALTAAAITAAITAINVPVTTLYNQNFNFAGGSLNTALAAPANLLGFRVFLNNTGGAAESLTVQVNNNASGQSMSVNVYVPVFAQILVPIPIAANQGDNVQLVITVLASGQTTFVSWVGVGENPAVQTTQGFPLSTYPVGGTLHAAANVTSGTVGLVGAPPVGMALRLHTVAYTAAANVITSLIGASSGFTYFTGNGITTIWLGGQLVPEALNLSAVFGTGTANLMYDVVSQLQAFG
jgi:hypothetical protein